MAKIPEDEFETTLAEQPAVTGRMIERLMGYLGQMETTPKTVTANVIASGVVAEWMWRARARCQFWRTEMPTWWLFGAA